MPTYLNRRIRGLSPALAASVALLASGCAQDLEGHEADGYDDMADEADAGLDEKVSSGQGQLRNEGTGKCLRRSTSQKVGNGYEVYQSSCSDTASETQWRADCSGSSCKYITSGNYCLKASGSVKASGGSYNVYAAPCSSDKDQVWSVRDLGGGRLQLKNSDTGRCAYTSEAEKTADGNPQVVQRTCGTSTKFQFTLAGGGGSTGGGSTGGGSTGGGSTGGGGTGGGDGVITHVGTTEVWDSNGQDVRVARPSGIQAGDLLVLFLHRTDDVLPLQVNGWKRVAECYKTDNGYQCATASSCKSWYNSSFCRDFSTGAGRDLAQSVFVKTAGSNEPSSYSFNMNMDSSGHPGWAILTALRGADTSNPVRDWAHVGCDNSSKTIFPSVNGQAGDMLLMSQSFDDKVAQSLFGAPSGASTFGYVSNSDEAGFLFGRRLSSSGETGKMSTNGSGASGCKDAAISLTIRPR